MFNFQILSISSSLVCSHDFYICVVITVRTDIICKQNNNKTNETFTCCWSFLETLESIREVFFLQFDTNLSCCELTRHKFVLNKNKVFLFNSHNVSHQTSVGLSHSFITQKTFCAYRSPIWNQHSKIYKSDDTKSPSINRIFGWFEVQVCNPALAYC